MEVISLKCAFSKLVRVHDAPLFAIAPTKRYRTGMLLHSLLHKRFFLVAMRRRNPREFQSFVPNIPTLLTILFFALAQAVFHLVEPGTDDLVENSSVETWYR